MRLLIFAFQKEKEYKDLKKRVNNGPSDYF